MFTYLIASLPRLELGAVPPLDADELLERCRATLPERDVAELVAFTEGADGPHGAGAGAAGATAASWRALETQIRNGVARRRAQRLGVPAEPHRRPHAGYRGDIDAAVDAAFEQPDPMARERELDALRWRLLDDLAAVDPWGLPFVLAYAMRLRLAQRWAALTAGGPGRDARVAGLARVDAYVAGLEVDHD